MTALSDNLLIDHQLQYFSSFFHDHEEFQRSKRWWTLLILAPLGEPGAQREPDIGLWLAITKQIHSFMAKASGSWVELADEFEKLLVLDDTKEFYPKTKSFRSLKSYSGCSTRSKSFCQ
jgi:hypothetical protein